MKTYHHGTTSPGPYFEGWYLKHQTKDKRALALIPALHRAAGQRPYATLQVAWEGGSWYFTYPVEAFRAENTGFCVQVGKNIFSEQGIDLHVEEKGLSLQGKLHYGLLTPPPGDVMGAFRLVPGLECVHEVLSLGHRLAGTLTINGETVDFTDGLGYVEGDRGRSFPRRYLWSQCAWEDVRVMGAVATVPWKRWQFTGCICLVAQAGRVLRLATDKGARVERWDQTGAVVRQGRYRLSMEYLTGQSLPLQAPEGGGMNRCVQECLQALVRYRLERGRTCLFDHTDPWASFEYGESE